MRRPLADRDCPLAEVADDLDQLGARAAVLAREDDEVAGAGGDGAAVWCSGDGDAAAAAVRPRSGAVVYAVRIERVEEAAFEQPLRHDQWAYAGSRSPG